MGFSFMGVSLPSRGDCLFRSRVAASQAGFIVDGTTPGGQGVSTHTRQWARVTQRQQSGSCPPGGGELGSTALRSKGLRLHPTRGEPSRGRGSWRWTMGYSRSCASVLWANDAASGGQGGLASSGSPSLAPPNGFLTLMK